MRYTPELLAMWDIAVSAAKASRRIFGQLWMPDPTYDDILRCVWEPFVAEAINTPNPLKKIFVEFG